MDKYEYKLCVEEIQSLINQKKYKEAVDIADTVDWKNEKSIGMLCKISDLYKMCKRYEDSRDVLLLAYHRNPSGRLIIYSLCELSLKLKDLENAYEFYREYTLVAPKDYSRLVLKYKIYSARGVDLERRIATLEELQQIDYKEKWMYELAYLYHCAGNDDKCVEECDQIILFYGNGKYVIKALELKAAHTELTATQEALYKKLTAPAEPEISVAGIDAGTFSEIDLQKELANSMQEVLADEKTVQVPAEDTQATAIFSPEDIEKALESEAAGETRVIDTDAISREMERLANRQEEELLAKADTAEIRITDISTPVITDISAPKAPEPVQYEIPIPEPIVTPAEDKLPPRNLSSEREYAAIGNPAVSRVVEPESYDRSKTNGWGVHELSIGEINNPAIKYPSYDDMVSVQGDGQLSFVMPEEEKVDKQITGQISIDDIMLEWERLKQKSEKDWTEGFKRRIQEQTEGMFKSFEESAKSGLLEQLESDAAKPIVAEPALQNPYMEPAIMIVEEEPASDISPDVSEPVVETVSEPAAALDITAVPEIVAVPESVDMHEIVIGTDTAAEEVPADVAVADEPSGNQPADDEPLGDEPEPIDPTPAELSFDRTPFIGKAYETEPEITSNDPEPPAEDNTGVIPSTDIDYLLRFAEAGEEHDRLEAQTMEAKETAVAAEVLAVADAVADATTAEPSADIDGSEPEESAKTEAEPEEPAKAEPEAEEKSEGKEPKAEEIKPEAVPERVTGLTPEQDERFESFIQTDFGLEQIKQALENIAVEPGKGNLIITSEDKDSALELGKSFIMELSDRGLITGKVAKIKAETLNKSKDPANTLSALKDGALMILDAGELSKEAFLAIQKAETENGANIFMALIVRRRNKNKFMNACGDILGSFDTSVEIEALDDANLVKLATEYAFRREFAIDEMGLLELHRRIADMQSDSHKVLLTEVKTIVDEAINHAVRVTPANFFRVLTGRRYNSNDMIVLTQRDFEE